jgi:hypothetical protein
MRRLSFFECVKIDEATGCWNFDSWANRNGYPYGTYYGKPMPVHRIAAILWLKFTDWRNSKRFVLHKCDNRKCVNPKHLSIGSALDNSLDCSAKRRFANQRKTHCPKGHPYSAGNLILEGDGKYRRCAECKRETGRNWMREQRRKAK